MEHTRFTLTPDNFTNPGEDFTRAHAAGLVVTVVSEPDELGDYADMGVAGDVELWDARDRREYPAEDGWIRLTGPSQSYPVAYFRPADDDMPADYVQSLIDGSTAICTVRVEVRHPSIPGVLGEASVGCCGVVGYGSDEDDLTSIAGDMVDEAILDAEDKLHDIRAALCA